MALARLLYEEINERTSESAKRDQTACTLRAGHALPSPQNKAIVGNRRTSVKCFRESKVVFLHINFKQSNIYFIFPS